MLSSPLRPIRLPGLKVAHLSLASVGLMWILPFLHYRHRLPLTTFDQEWWSALLGLLALILLVGRDFWRQPEIPRIAQLPAALIVVVALQRALGKIVYFDQAMLYILYLLFAALLMILGARLRECFGMAILARALAMFLVIGAELSSLIGVLQHYRWNTPLDAVIVTKVSSSVYGNLAQPNHFANYIALGLVSLGLLHQQRRLKTGYVVALAMPLLLVMTLSGSRSTWLYLLMMTGLAWWWARRDTAHKPLLRYSLLLTGGFGVMHLIVQLPFMAGADGSIDTVQRLLGANATIDIRLYLWREAALMLMQSPWIGVGFGQFSWHHFQLLPVLQQSNISGLYNNAHNLILHLAAEAGMAGLLILFASAGVWLHGLQRTYAIFNPAGANDDHLRRTRAGPEHWWGLAVLGVLAIHSMLEYPLWYAYFVAIAAILLGALDETRYRLELRIAGRVSVSVVLLWGVVALVQLRTGYQQLEQVMAIRPASLADCDAFARIREGLAELHGDPLLSPYVELPLSGQIVVNDEHLKEKLALNTRVLRFMPIGAVVYRQAMLLAQGNQPEQAKTVLEQAVWSYPAGVADVRRQMAIMADKDPEHFSALLEFAIQKEQEYRRAVHHQ